MSLPTAFFGLIKAAEGEPYDLDVVNNNLDQVDLGLVKIDSAFSTTVGATWDFTASQFTRVRIKDKGIIIAKFVGTVLTTTALPLNTASGLVISGVVPAGYRPGYTLNYSQAIASGAGRGDEVQVAITGGTGNFLARSNTGVAYNTVVGSAINYHVAWQWDGVL